MVKCHYDICSFCSLSYNGFIASSKENNLQKQSDAYSFNFQYRVTSLWSSYHFYPFICFL